MVFDPVDHKILLRKLRKLKLHIVASNDLKWFERYLSNRNRYIQITNSENAKNVKTISFKNILNKPHFKTHHLIICYKISLIKTVT